jgi:hypothetical protein
MNLINNYLKNEMKLFLRALNTKERIEKFFQLIKSNVLTRPMMEIISADFKKSIKGSNGTDFHPFCELYNLGLLGELYHSHDSDKIIQRFKKPYNFDWKMSCIIPKCSYYLIHPSLRDWISKCSQEYSVERKILIGDGYKWESEYDTHLNSKEIKVFISYSSKDSKFVHKFSKVLRENLLRNGCYCDIWLDKWKMKGGDCIQEGVERGLAESDLLLLMLSAESAKSGWVEKEWRTKIEEEITQKKIKIITCILDDTTTSSLPKMLQVKQSIFLDQTKAPSKKQIIALINDLKEHLAAERSKVK